MKAPAVGVEEVVGVLDPLGDALEGEHGAEVVGLEEPRQLLVRDFGVDRHAPLRSARAHSPLPRSRGEGWGEAEGLRKGARGGEGWCAFRVVVASARLPLTPALSPLAGRGGLAGALHAAASPRSSRGRGKNTFSSAVETVSTWSA